MAKKQGWIKFRHKVVTEIIRPIFGPYVRWKYGIRIEKFPDQGDRPYLILMNHQTAYDQFFVGLTFHRPVYYLASEDIFSMGWVSRLIRWLVAPIPIKKQTTDLQAVKNCILVAREGGTICIAPEGHRTFHGRTVYMNPSIANLARKLGLPIVIFRIEGGYGIHPRWSDVVRRGKMRSYVKRVIEPEEYAGMTSAQLFELLEQELTVDEARVTGQFRHKKNAEFLDRVFYTCPWCGLSPFESRDDIIRCTTCGRQIRHRSTKELEGVDFEFPHRFVSDWYGWQNSYVSGLDTLAMTREPVFEDQASVSLVIPGSHKKLLQKQTTVRLYGDRVTAGSREFPFSDLSAVVLLGKNKINIYAGDGLYQLSGVNKGFNGLKYLNFYHHYKNQRTGDHNGKFLGL